MMLLVALSATQASAQAFQDRLHCEISTGQGPKAKGITPFDISMKIHVDIIPMTYAFINLEENIALYKRNDVKTYFHGTSLGGGLGVKLLNSVKTNHALDVRLQALGSLGNPDWKRTTYDASLAWYLKNKKYSPIIQFGYRHIDSRNDAIDDYDNIYMALGLRF